MRGIWCCDPGGSSGVAWGIIDETRPRAIDAVAARLSGGSATITGEVPAQVRALFLSWIRFKSTCVNVGLLDPANVDLVMEDFILRGGPVVAGRSGTLPLSIAWGFEGYRMGRRDEWAKSHKLSHYTPITWQQPGAAARFGNKSILQDSDAWVKGREHERTAFSHMLLRANAVMEGRKIRN